MSLAIFGISNSGLNLAVSLLVLIFVVVWLALIVYTYLDARRRLSDPFLVACATIASFFPYVGTAVYAIVRPPEFLEDARERELEIKAAEMRVRQLTESSCPKCEYPVEKNFLRCPNCRHRLKDPCPSCSRPVAPSWKVCPYCEAVLQARETRTRRGEERKAAPREDRGAPDPGGQSRREERAPGEERTAPKRQPVARKKGTAATDKEPATRAVSKEAASPKRQQRSPSREPDPDPRQA
ncbi:MAG: zinc ribbon domain-containing protein [Solirubrobacterales bacterium]